MPDHSKLIDSPSIESLADVDPYEFYNVATLIRIVRKTRTNPEERLVVVKCDDLGQIPGYEVWRILGINWDIDRSRLPRRRVNKKLRVRI